jgi:hypothetical protein
MRCVVHTMYLLVGSNCLVARPGAKMYNSTTTSRANIEVRFQPPSPYFLSQVPSELDSAQLCVVISMMSTLQMARSCLLVALARSIR